MNSDKKVHREILSSGLATGLLNTTVGGSSQTVITRLRAAQEELSAAVISANSFLAGHPLAEIVAEHVAQSIRRRGEARILVDENGVVVLEVTPNRGRNIPKSQKLTSSPPLTDLREEARQLGLDPEPFGRSKQKLLAAIKEARKPAPVPQIQPDSSVIIPDKVPEVLAKRPKIPTPKSGEPPMRQGRRLSAIVSSADVEVDVDAILARPAPSPPPSDLS